MGFRRLSRVIYVASRLVFACFWGEGERREVVGVIVYRWEGFVFLLRTSFTSASPGLVVVSLVVALEKFGRGRNNLVPLFMCHCRIAHCLPPIVAGTQVG